MMIKMHSCVNDFLRTVQALQAEQCRHSFKLPGLPESSRISLSPAVLVHTSVTLRMIRMNTKTFRNLSGCPIEKLTFSIHSISHANQGPLCLEFKRFLNPMRKSSSLLPVSSILGISYTASITVIVYAFLFLF